MVQTEQKEQQDQLFRVHTVQQKEVVDNIQEGNGLDELFTGQAVQERMFRSALQRTDRSGRYWLNDLFMQ